MPEHTSDGPSFAFAQQTDLRPLSLGDQTDLAPVGLAIGSGSGALEVAIAHAASRPTQAAMRTAWKFRHGGRGIPLLLVAAYGDRAALCGPTGEEPPVYFDLHADQVDRICRTALEEPNRNAAIRFLHSVLPDIGESVIPGLRNEGLFATHELDRGVPELPAWKDAQRKAEPLLGQRGKPLLKSLGFQIIDTNQPYAILRAKEKKVAVAVFLDRSEAADLASNRFNGMTPIQYALAKADEENLDYVVVDHGPALRVYTVASSKGVGRRGRTETFVEVHLDLLPSQRAGYLWLLFSADALSDRGTFSSILDRSHDYATDLGTRLRERIYDEVVPQLAVAIARARDLKKPTAADLETTYEMALLVLFRLLFIAYAEDKDLLPYRTNELYKSRSLKTKARELADLRRNLLENFDDSTSLWEEVVKLFGVVNDGRPKEWGVPGYNGGMFSEDSAVSAAGALLAKIKLPNNAFGPVLSHLLVDNAPEGLGPVDFRSLGVREFGTIYEGLLESELSVAETDLSVDKEGLYVPVKGKLFTSIKAGQIYLHNASGARKSTASYFTKLFAVEYLLDRALEPAITDHLVRLDKLDDRAAAEAFFDFRVADISMGSGHFLVAGVDRIERRFSTYLAKRPLPGVNDELARLRQTAIREMEKVGHTDLRDGIDNVQLLRRQIARRCIYGVDNNKLAVQLARLSLWIHTFVPGLPLSFLDHNIVHGNSLVGIATMDEAKEMLSAGVGAGGLFADVTEKYLGPVREQVARLSRLSDADAGQIAEARKAFVEAKAVIGEAKLVFDILTASRLPESGLTLTFATLEKEKVGKLREMHRTAQTVLSNLLPFHFPFAFPEVFLRERPGFDVILGNPPWEEVKVEEDEFWARYSPGFKALNLHDRDKFKKRLKSARPDLAQALSREVAVAETIRNALIYGPYHGMGVGDADLYKGFSWRFWQLVSSHGGRIGVVLPRSALSVKGSSEFRKTVFCEGSLEVTFLVNNGRWVFPEVHAQYTVALTCIRRGMDQESKVSLRGPYRDLAALQFGTNSTAVSFPAATVLTWTDTAALPLLPAADSAEVFVQLRKAPRLDADIAGSWKARPLSEEIHSRKEQHLMRQGEAEDGDWPVYKGESFDLWKPDTGTYYGWTNPETTMDYLQSKRSNGSRKMNSPFAEFADRPVFLRNRATLPCCSPRIAIRRVTNRTNQRTIIAALIPANVFLADQASCLLWPRGDEQDVAFLIGVLSSISIDWYARRFVEIDVRIHIINPLPIPRVSRTSGLWKRVVFLAGRLACPDKRFKQWAEAVGVDCAPLKPDVKDDMIAELDAVVAHLYGLSEPQLRHIFETFHEGWDYRPRLEAGLRHFRTWEGKQSRP